MRYFRTRERHPWIWRDDLNPKWPLSGKSPGKAPKHMLPSNFVCNSATLLQFSQKFGLQRVGT